MISSCLRSGMSWSGRVHLIGYVVLFLFYAEDRVDHYGVDPRFKLSNRGYRYMCVCWSMLSDLLLAPSYVGFMRGLGDKFF